MQANGASTISSLRQWRKKDFLDKQCSTEAAQVGDENPSHIARVAPHTYYPRPQEEPCNYSQQYGEYGAPYKHPVPVKYSEIVENHPQSIEQPVIQKQKEKEYIDLCGDPHLKQFPDHIPMKQNAYPDSPSIPHHYSFLQKQPQMHQYIQKEPYHQFMSKYSMQNHFSQPYNSESNNFLAHLNKINPRMAQSIINDTHLRDSQLQLYHNLEQSRSYPHQRMYHPSNVPSNPNNPQRNIDNYNYPQYNYKPNISPNDPYNRMHQYHHKYVPDQHYYNEHTNYGPYPPNYSQLEYAQHYQHRRQFPQDYYPHPSYKGPFAQAPQISPVDIIPENGTRKSTLKQYLETWMEEDGVNVTDIIAPSSTATAENLESVKGTVPVKAGGNMQDQPLYVLDTTDIPSDNLPHFLHLQQIEKLPDNIKGYYQTNAVSSERRVIQENPSKQYENSAGAIIIPEIFNQNCSLVATAEKNLENKVVQIHILENSETTDVDGNVSVILNAQEQSLSDDCCKSVESSNKSMPDIDDEEEASKDEEGSSMKHNELPTIVENAYACSVSVESNVEHSEAPVITNLDDKAITNKELIISSDCDTQNIQIDLNNITKSTNMSKDSEQTDLNNEIEVNTNISGGQDIFEKEQNSPQIELENFLNEITFESTETEDNHKMELSELVTEVNLEIKGNELTFNSPETKEMGILVSPSVPTYDTIEQQLEELNKDIQTVVNKASKKKGKLKRDLCKDKQKRHKKPGKELLHEEATPMPEVQDETTATDGGSMPILEPEEIEENETNVVYHINDSNIVLQIADELLEINVSIQNGKKTILVKTFSDTVITNNAYDVSCPILEDQTTVQTEAVVENDNTVNVSLCDEPEITIDSICICNEEIVSSSTENEHVPKEDVIIEGKVSETNLMDKMEESVANNVTAKKSLKTKAALKLIEPQIMNAMPSKPKSKGPLKLTKFKKESDYIKRKEKDIKLRREREMNKNKVSKDRRSIHFAPIWKNNDREKAKNIDMLYKMSIVPESVTKARNKEQMKSEVKILTREPLVNVQENSITSSTSQETEAVQRERANKLIQQINDDWEDDLDVKQDDGIKRRLSLQEYNDRKRLQEHDLTSNLLQNVTKARVPVSPEHTDLNIKCIGTYSHSEGAADKREEPLSSRIQLQLPKQRRYNQEYLRNALRNDLHTVNQITTTLMRENQALMQRFLEQQRLTACELKKVKQIIRYKRLVQHLTNMKLKEAEDIELPEHDLVDVVNSATVQEEKKLNMTGKRKKKRFRFLYSDSESEMQDFSSDKMCCLKKSRVDNVLPPADYSVHQRNSQGQLTLVFKRSFKSDPKMQPFVKLERIRSLDWLANKLQ
ncbi:hypothetical protein FQA39_LY18199 [Lamprigera yunnana]|nr:hypothetical protein FQA39_LY18199 [Lamprigera yunnana]